MANPLQELTSFGQAPWLDFIRRSLVESGELARLVQEDGIRGVTSNPAIFEKAIAKSDDYADWMKELEGERLSPEELYERLAVRDIRAAADVLLPVFRESDGADGFVSLEVSPHLAHETESTVDEAQRLWDSVSRPNVMIKVPGTAAGLPAIEELISRGVNVNVTLLFSVSVYEEVAEAYLRGLEARHARGDDVSHGASVASFFVSRIDSAVDARLRDSSHPNARSLEGRTAIANAKMAYQRFRTLFESPRFEALENAGARRQRVLWASTSTKNPSYPDTLYVEALIGPYTVNTLTMESLEAYRDHGEPAARLEEGLDDATEVLEQLSTVGVSLDAVTEELTRDGVKAFADAFDQLLGALAKRSGPTFHARLPSELARELDERIQHWETNGKMRRLWDKDASLWTGSDEDRWLGWLDLPESSSEHLETYRSLAAEVQTRALRDVVVLGMGGSSLAPEVLAKTLGPVEGFPALAILDSTSPAQILELERRLEPAETLFIVSSKSGTTLEPNVFYRYFRDWVARHAGTDEAGSHFIAVTDPGSALEETARSDRFAHVYAGIPSVGGRYSALSNFGLIPAATMGVDIEDFLRRARRLASQMGPDVPVSDNPGAYLGLVLGVAALSGRDKLTLVMSPGLEELGAWLEQLIAESTGKGGHGIIPVDREPLGDPSVYGRDRLFVYTRLGSASDTAQDEAIELIARDGHPVLTLDVADRRDLAREFFQWEIATAVLGSVLGINPFDQPDVEASKVATRKLSKAFEETGRFPEPEPIFERDGTRLYTDPRNEKRLGRPGTWEALVRAHVQRAEAGDYVALLAYLEMDDEHVEILQSIRRRLRDRLRVATCVGFGPRFLHSTGQLHKGGPDSGVFLQITSDPIDDPRIPGRELTFGAVQSAQALGDFEVLLERGRRALRVHFTGDAASGLTRLRKALDEL